MINLCTKIPNLVTTVSRQALELPLSITPLSTVLQSYHRSNIFFTMLPKLPSTGPIYNHSTAEDFYKSIDTSYICHNHFKFVCMWQRISKHFKDIFHKDRYDRTLVQLIKMFRQTCFNITTAAC